MNFQEKFQNEINNSHVQSVGKALVMIEYLSYENRELSLTEIAHGLDWPKSTVHGLISTLRDFQFVEQSTLTGKYRLGIRLFELGNAVKRSWDISAVAHPHLQRLNNQLGDMVQLAAERGGEVLYLDKLESRHTFRIVSDVGISLPMHCSGLGKVLLAYKKEAEVKRIIKQKGMKAMTQYTITTYEGLKKELEKIRRVGYGIDDQEIMEGLRCVAAPIFNSNDEALYAVSVSGLYYSLQGQHFEDIISALKTDHG